MSRTYGQATTSLPASTKEAPLSTSSSCYGCGTPLPVSTREPLPISWLGRRRRLMVGASAAGVIAIALAWQWSWLVVLGVAPLLLSLAPCAAMCALGLCMHRMAGRSRGTADTEMTPARQQRDAAFNEEEAGMITGD